MKIALLALIGWVALAQETLRVGQPVTGELGGTRTLAFVASFSPGDYISATERGKFDLNIRQSDGTLVRRYRSSAAETRRQISFMAESGGDYRIELVNTSEASAVYEFVISTVTSLEVRLAAAMPDRFTSPTIDRLRNQMPRDTDAFWQEVARSGGSPIVEPYEKDQNYQLVTFLWKSTPTTRNVVVLALTGALKRLRKIRCTGS